MTPAQVQEFIVCKRDPVYFTDAYAYIEHPTRGVIPFKLYDFQKDILRKYLANQFNILNKARQTGISTLTASFALWLAMFHNDKNIVIISMTDQDAMDFLKKVKTAYHNLPAWLKGEPIVDNAHELELTNGSRIRSVASSDRAGRGKSPSLLIIDECAFINKIEKIWLSSYPSLSKGGKGILISTPNGIGNFFHHTWERAKSAANEFVWTFIHWSQVPEYDQAWYERMRKQIIDPREWAQEYEGDFISSGDTVVEGIRLKEILGQMQDALTKEWKFKPIEMRHNNKLWIFKKPIPGHYYVIGVDTASGVAGEYSAFQVLDLDEQEQVAEFQGKLSINEYAKITYDTAKEYNTAYMVVENNGIGLATVNKLYKDLGYPNFYLMENIRTGKMTKMAGFSMTKARGLVIGGVQRYFTENIWKFYSERLFNEMLTFIWNDGKAMHADGYTDDLVISLGISYYSSEWALRNRPISAYPDEKVIELPEDIQPFSIFAEEDQKYRDELEKIKDDSPVLPPDAYSGSEDEESDTNWLLGG